MKDERARVNAAVIAMTSRLRVRLLAQPDGEIAEIESDADALTYRLAGRRPHAALSIGGMEAHLLPDDEFAAVVRERVVTAVRDLAAQLRAEADRLEAALA